MSITYNFRRMFFWNVLLFVFISMDFQFFFHRFLFELFITRVYKCPKIIEIWRIKGIAVDIVSVVNQLSRFDSKLKNYVGLRVKNSKSKSEMEPLVTTRQVLTWLWMCSDNKVSNKWKKLGQYASGQFCLIFQILSFSVTTAFFIRFLSIDIEKCLFESMFVSGHFNAAIAITHAMQSRHKITTLFTQLSKIYRDGMYK